MTKTLVVLLVFMVIRCLSLADSLDKGAGLITKSRAACNFIKELFKVVTMSSGQLNLCEPYKGIIGNIPSVWVYLEL